MTMSSTGGKHLLAFFITSCLSAVICLYLVRIDPGRVHLLGLDQTLNDQAVYIDAARHIRDDGMFTIGPEKPRARFIFRNVREAALRTLHRHLFRFGIPPHDRGRLSARA